MYQGTYRNTLKEAQAIITLAMEYLTKGARGFSVAYFSADVASADYSSVERGNALYAIEKVFRSMSDCDLSVDILRNAFDHLQMRRWIFQDCD